MPALTRKIPRYTKHKASGQAVVTLSGEDFYLGPHGTKTSKLEYDRVVAEWLARGRQPRRSSDITVIELIADYLEFAQGYYRKNGKVTAEFHAVAGACKLLKRLYGRDAANEFGPLKLQVVQKAMIDAGWARKSINKQCGRIVRMFAWGVSKELVRADVAHGLRELPGLKAGRCEARETAPVAPVADSVINATIEHLPPIVADMVRLQRLTGCRPEEICLLRPCDIDTSGSVWAYRPQSHKTEHHGRERVIFIGPKGQDVLRPYLLRDKASYCFCPAEGERKRRDAAHEARTTPLHLGNRPGTNKRRKPKRAAGERYDTASYRRAIARACDLAFGLPPELKAGPDDETAEQREQRRMAAKEWRALHTWSPNQLRHSAATEIRKRFGLEAAQVTLGHSSADVSQIYAERDLGKAAEIMAAVG